MDSPSAEKPTGSKGELPCTGAVGSSTEGRTERDERSFANLNLLTGGRTECSQAAAVVRRDGGHCVPLDGTRCQLGCGPAELLIYRAGTDQWVQLHHREMTSKGQMLENQQTSRKYEKVKQNW